MHATTALALPDDAGDAGFGVVAPELEPLAGAAALLVWLGVVGAGLVGLVGAGCELDPPAEDASSVVPLLDNANTVSTSRITAASAPPSMTRRRQ
jgi:hypothetical protein